MDEEEFKPLFEQYSRTMFEDTHGYDSRQVLTAEEIQRTKVLGQRLGTPYKLYLGAFDGNDQFVGWSWGLQESATTYYMVNSAVLENYRRKGLYTLLLNRSVEVLSEKGFQLIYSRHNATNNAVIIPKLKAGFIISKMELDDKFGVLVHLHYYTNPERRRIMDYRAGQIRPDERLKALFGI